MTRHKALFLDRDGIINEDYGYVSTTEQFKFIDGIFELCRLARTHDYLIIIITNQSGIARGFYTLSDFLKLNEWMLDQFAAANIVVTATYYCPHLPTGTIPEFSKICDCRKPEPGMFLTAAQHHNIDLANSIMIGDKNSDMLAAQKAGVGTKILMSNQKSGIADIFCTEHKELFRYFKH